ncbi:MAG: DUF4037 domain-containing protein [Spirochaetales bacterium]|nr:DUF4037 domain-containing protein [Spirochaetales bacterium]
MAKYKFIPGLDLNRGFYQDIVKPLLEREFPGVPYSASLIGYGSDVTGFDDETSMDHNWGPRMQIFLSPDDFNALSGQIDAVLKEKLPLTYKGFPVNFSEKSPDGTQRMEQKQEGPVRHLIEIVTIEDFFNLDRYLGISVNGLSDVRNWFNLKDQKLLELTSGEVFFDGLNTLKPLRDKLGFFPKDIWFLRLAALWDSVSQEEAFIGRQLARGNFMGARLIASRLVTALMKICFLMEKKYVPYSKWFGVAFRKLTVSNRIEPVIDKVLTGSENTLENNLCHLYEKVVERNNTIPELPLLNNKIHYFYGRPYRVIYAETIVKTFMEAISDVELRKTDPDIYRNIYLD